MSVESYHPSLYLPQKILSPSLNNRSRVESISYSNSQLSYLDQQNQQQHVTQVISRKQNKIKKISPLEQRQYQLSKLFSTSLKFINKNHEFINFKNKILVPKRKKQIGEFLNNNQVKQLKTKLNKSNNLLINGLKRLKDQKSQKQKDKKLNIHNIHDKKKSNQKIKISQNDDRYSQNCTLKRSISLQSPLINYINRHVHHLTNKYVNSSKSYHQHSFSHDKLEGTHRSISKIQQLTNKSKQQTIALNEYHNEDYIFLNINNNFGESKDLFDFTNNSKIQLTNPSKKQLNKKINKSNDKQFTPTEVRSKNRSLTKYDRTNTSVYQKKSPASSLKINVMENGSTECISKFKASQQKIYPQSQPPNLIKLISIKNDTKAKGTESPRKINPFLSPSKLISLSLNKSNSHMSPSRYNITSQSAAQLFQKELENIRINAAKQPDCLLHLLASISMDPNPDTIRIYREDFGKIYNYRYARERITSFFDYQYIEDYPSLHEIWQQKVLPMNRMEVLLMSFLMLDTDNDGLITHTDLFKLLINMDKNELIKKNVYKILQYVKSKVQKSGQLIRDKCDQQYLRKDNLTLKKYKFMVYMKQKKKYDDKTNKSNVSLSKYSHEEELTTTRKSSMKAQDSPNQINFQLHKQLFTLKQHKEQIPIEKHLLQMFLESISKNVQPNRFTGGIASFQINFERFYQEIFYENVPEIYYDMLFSAFGYKHQNLNYFPLDYETPLRKQKRIVEIQQEMSKQQILHHIIEQMREQKVDLSKKLFKNDIKRNRKIKSSLA